MDIWSIRIQFIYQFLVDEEGEEAQNGKIKYEDSRQQINHFSWN